jgi:serine O-acetyltransferase
MAPLKPSTISLPHQGEYLRSTNIGIDSNWDDIQRSAAAWAAAEPTLAHTLHRIALEADMPHGSISGFCSACAWSRICWQREVSSSLIRP